MTNEKPGREPEASGISEPPPNPTSPGFEDEGDPGSQAEERQREKEGNRGPDEEPGFGQGA